MKNRLIISLLLLAPIFIIGQDSKWDLKKEKNGIQIYTRPSSTGVNDSKAVTTIEASAEKVISILRDAGNHANWMAATGASKVLELENESSYKVYYISDAPWPVNDRDLVSQWTVVETEEKVIISSEPVNDYLDEDEDYVRLTDCWTRWEIFPVNDNQCKLVYYGHVDPAGSIPDWLANATATETPYKSLLALKEKVE